MDVQQLVKQVVEQDSVLRAYIYSVTRNHDDTNDIVQNTWQALARRIDAYDDRRAFRAWAIGVARLEVAKWRQRQARAKEVLSPEVIELLADMAVEEAPELDLRAAYLAGCLAKLGGLGERVLRLKYYREWSIRQIAGRLRRNVPAVEMALVRARRALRDCIEERVRASQVET
jgi:RNA polymerase sigma-70 factor (ECF subfamily)